MITVGGSNRAKTLAVGASVVGGGVVSILAVSSRVVAIVVATGPIVAIGSVVAIGPAAVIALVVAIGAGRGSVSTSLCGCLGLVDRHGKGFVGGVKGLKVVGMCVVEGSEACLARRKDLGERLPRLLGKSVKPPT